MNEWISSRSRAHTMNTNTFVTEELLPETSSLQRGYNRITPMEREAGDRKDNKDKIKIGVAGISPSSGVSVLSVSFACYASAVSKKTVSVVEMLGASIYNSLGMDKRFAGREFWTLDQLRKVENGRKIQSNVDEGINWMLRDPMESPNAPLFMQEESTEYQVSLIHKMKGDLVLYDLSGGGAHDASRIFRMMQEMDHCVVVIDPLPSKMLQSRRILHEIQLSKLSVSYIINKMNRGVEKKEMIDFLRINHPTYVPLLDQEGLYEAEYRCKNPYVIPSVKKLLKEPFEKLWNQIPGIND